LTRCGRLFMVVLLCLIVANVIPFVRGAVVVLYDQCGLAYENGVYYHKVVLRNDGSTSVRVVVKVKTAIDYSAKTSAPVDICAGCTVTVRVDVEQPPSTQTSEQREKYIYFLSHPEYIRVEETSSASGGGIPGFPMESMLVGLIVALAILVVSRRRRASLRPAPSAEVKPANS